MCENFTVFKIVHYGTKYVKHVPIHTLHTRAWLVTWLKSHVSVLAGSQNITMYA